MAITFLEAVNATLKRVRVIQGDAGELATSTVTSTATGAVATDAFVDSGRQVQIDLAIQLWNEAGHIIYQKGMFASGVASATTTLVADQREYDVPSDFERLTGKDRGERVLRGATNGLILQEYPGGYSQMLADFPVASDYRGSPLAWALSPVSGKIVMQNTPTTGEENETYNWLYEKRLSLTSTMATETLPYSDTVADALVPVVAEGWNRIMKQEFSSGNFEAGINRALSYVARATPRRRYGTRRG